MTLGQKIQLRRIELDINQSDLAKKIGTCIQTIGRIERDGGLPNLEIFAKLCAVLDVSPDFFVKRYDQSRKSQAWRM